MHHPFIGVQSVPGVNHIAYSAVHEIITKLLVHLKQHNKYPGYYESVVCCISYVTQPWPLIGQYKSRDLNTELSLVQGPGPSHGHESMARI